jgi:Ca2+-binding EF-hand superfamily protein
MVEPPPSRQETFIIQKPQGLAPGMRRPLSKGVKKKKKVMSHVLTDFMDDQDRRSSNFWQNEQRQPTKDQASAKVSGDESPKRNFDFVLGGGFGKNQPVENQRNLFIYAIRLKVPMDVLTSAAQIFEMFAEVPPCKFALKGGIRNRFTKAERLQQQQAASNILEDGYVTVDKFGDMLCRLLGYNSVGELPKTLLTSCFKAADQNSGGQVEFEEFALWLSRHVFSEEFLLSEEEKELRAVARQCKISLDRIDYMRRCFEFFDEDRSGLLDQGEFSQLLHVILKIPKHIQLPKSRLDAMWAEADSNGGGDISFEEFLLFYKKYFDPANPHQNPIETFYRRIRPHGCAMATT